jgi:hypothetical protein
MTSDLCPSKKQGGFDIMLEGASVSPTTGFLLSTLSLHLFAHCFINKKELLAQPHFAQLIEALKPESCSWSALFDEFWLLHNNTSSCHWRDSTTWAG